MVGRRVERLARRQQRAQVRHRLWMIRHRPPVTLAHDAIPVILRRGAQPDGHGGLLRAARRSAATSTMPPPVASTIGRRSASSAVERLALEPAVVVLSVQREQLVQRQVGRLLDPAIELDERHVQPAREPLPDRRLAGAAQTEQRDDRGGSSVGVSSRSVARGPRRRAASSASRRTEMLARPASSCTRKRIDTPERSASSRSVQRPAGARLAHPPADEFRRRQSVITLACLGWRACEA